MVYYPRIEQWIHSNAFPDRASVEAYIAIHGGKSSGMDDTLDFIFGSKSQLTQEQYVEALEQQPVTPQTLFEELTGVKQPQSLEEIRGTTDLQSEILRRAEQAQAQNIPQEPPSPENIAQRLRKFLSSLFR